MKKLIITFIFINLFFINSLVYSFGINFEGNGFYSSIDKSVNELEGKIYSIEIVGENGTKEGINEIAGSNCLNKNLSGDQIESIVKDGNLNIIIQNISPSCIEKGKISQKTINNYIFAINKFYNENIELSLKKTSQIFGISNNGIYADGIKENAPFDLIEDLKQIDSIIFSEETTLYEGEKEFDLGGELEKRLKEKQQINGKDLNLNNGINNQNLIITNSLSQNNNPENKDNIVKQEIYSNLNMCSEEASTSGLNENSINFLLNNVNKNSLNEKINNIDTQNKNGFGNTNGNNSLISPKNNYSKVTDNSEFPCDSFFCIDIEFITYNHSLLGGGFEDITIEYLLNRSNDHLKKFTNTSLIPSEMTINNFELGLKNLNLPDIFHMGFQISEKPVPILNIEPKDKEDKTIFSLENQMKSYYKSYGLDYNRRNDLSLFSKIETGKQIVANSQLLNQEKLKQHIQDVDNYLTEKRKQNNILTKTIKEKNRYDIMSDFEIQFRELEIFNKSINNYVKNLDTIVKNMLKIPTG